jgi:two-component system sensor histidine kinase AtoS
MLLIIFFIVSAGFLGIGFSMKALFNNELLKEKQILLFGLTRQLDRALTGSFEDILKQYNAQDLTRDEKIGLLNNELSFITDFVASGIDGVGVGYYSKKLDAIITYGPSSEFQYTVGTSIFKGHQGYEVMQSGESQVQMGELVRGRILNCMRPIIRENEVIGYIWANETLQFISVQMTKIQNQMFFLLLLTFFLIYLSVVYTTKRFIGQVDIIREGIQSVILQPSYRLPQLHGELNIIIDKVNELSNSVSYFKSFNKYVLDSVTNSVLALTPQGQIALVNPSFKEHFQWVGTDFCGEFIDRVFTESVLNLLYDGLKDVMLIRSRILIYNDRILEVNCNRVFNDEQLQLGVVFVFRDITLVRQYERQLQDRERMVTLGEMGLNVAHEIKNPLTAIKGFTQLLQKREMSDKQKNAYLVMVDEEVNRVNGLLNDMLLYGGRFKVILEEVDFVHLLQELIVIYRIAYSEVLFTLNLHRVDNLMLRIDNNRITQMLDNLVKNSVDAGADQIIISLSSKNEMITLAVSDNGKGIPPDLNSKIFTPFFTTKSEGTGFGLSLCMEIVAKHQGEISVESIPGKNTVFTILFNKQLLESIHEA